VSFTKIRKLMAIVGPVDGPINNIVTGREATTMMGITTRKRLNESANVFAASRL